MRKLKRFMLLLLNSFYPRANSWGIPKHRFKFFQHF